MCTLRRRSWLTITAALGILLATGCRTTPKRNNDVAKSPPPPPSADTVSQIAVMWSDAAIRQDNIPISRGFAGKLYLFGTEPGKTITPRGKFVFCAYDESTQKPENADRSNVKPDRTWEFDESEMRRSLKRDMVGWSYSFWLPYASPGPDDHNCSLMVVFVPETGPRVTSDWSQVTLPGIRGGSPSLQSIASDLKSGPESKQIMPTSATVPAGPAHTQP